MVIIMVMLITSMITTANHYDDSAAILPQGPGISWFTVFFLMGDIILS